MSRTQSILIYYDGSAEAKCALSRTEDLALSRGGEVHVLTVAETLSAIVASAGMLSDVACSDILTKAWHTLDEALVQLTTHGTSARGYVSHGRVVDCIAHHAALVDADMIVVGYRYRRGMERWWTPRSALEELAMHAHGRPVLAVPIR